MLARYGLIVICIAGIMTGAAKAQTGDPSPLKAAALALSKKIDAATRNGATAPRLNDLDGIVRNGFNRAAIRALPNNVSNVLESCQSVSGALNSYHDYTTKRADGSPLDPGVRSERETALQNEMILGIAAQDLCSKRILAVTTALLATLSPAELRDPSLMGEISQMRTRLAMRLQETIEAQTVANLRPDNFVLLRESTLEQADVGADAMTLNQRAAMRATIDSVTKTAPASSTAMLRLLRIAYSRVGCTGLCAVP